MYWGAPLALQFEVLRNLSTKVWWTPPSGGHRLTARWGGQTLTLHERIAGYKVPKLVTLHDQLPREDTGKIFKRRLREPYWEGRTRRVRRRGPARQRTLSRPCAPGAR